MDTGSPDRPPLAALPDAVATITPKIEPKLEPLDEPLFLSTPDAFLSGNPGDSVFPGSQLNLNATNCDSASAPSAEDNLYAEFYRTSEFLRSAFLEKLQEQGDIDLADPDSRAIVTVPQEEDQASVTVVSRRRSNQRFKELVRVTGFGSEDQRYFRDVVRRTRMVYDSLRIFFIVEEEKGNGEGSGKRLRGDLKAAAVLRDRGLWLNRDKRIVGSIPGVCIGDLFFYRMELCVVGLHGQLQAGIDYLPASQSSNGEPIATSIIVSGGYEDDEDAGDIIIYTGQGGQDKFGRQSVHQRLECGNLALERSMNYGVELRVIRGFKYEGSISGKVYVYDGLYKILDCWFDVGKSGFGVYKYKLLRIEGQPEMGSSILKFAQSLKIRPLMARPMGYVSLDISSKKEKLPVFLFNDIDNDHAPLCYEYIVKTLSPPLAYQNSGDGGGCECVLGCAHDCICAMKNGGEFAYDHNGILLRGKPLVFECGRFCRCSPSCRNRVSQKGVRNRLEVFRSRETAWGVRSLDLIPSGAFICEYAGVILTREQALVFAMNGDSLVYPNRFTDRWAEWGDLTQIFSDYSRPSYPSVPPLDFAMDLSSMRNVACYISHSSCPNVLVQFVLYDHNNTLFPHLMLFAMENIPPLRELSLDYGVADEWIGKLPICD